MEKKNQHLVVKKYLEDHSLVESNIISFNNFIEKRMQEIADEISGTIVNDDFEIILGKIKVGKPEIIEADGSSSKIMPYEARLRNLTYSAPITIEMTIKKGESVDSEIVDIGRIPIMVGSKICNTSGLSKEGLIQNYNDPKDTGGYFIIKGNERVMVLAEDLAENQPFIEPDNKNKMVLKLFSLKGTYRIPTLISEDKEGIINASFSRFRELPIIAVIKALGLTKESDIAKYIRKETDSIIINLYEFVNLAEKEDRMKKAVTLCKLVKQFLIAKENPHLRTDKDHYANKRVRLSGDLLATLLRVNLGILIKDIQYSLQKASKRKKFFSIKIIAKSTLFSHRVESAIATGSWTGERSGVTQNMQKTNYLDSISQLQRVSSMLPCDQENFLARTLHPTHYGRFCPIETPEGTEIGLRKNLALLAQVSTRVELDETKFLKDLEADGLDKIGIGGDDVFFNGRFIGTVKNLKDFVKRIREKRRAGELPIQLNVREDHDFQTILISTEPGRVLRPLIILENGASKLKNEHLIALEQKEMKRNDLIKLGIIEYLDAAEEENALVALYEEEITEKHTHLEIDLMDSLGAVTSLVPYGNHDQSSRLNRGSKTQKQALGLYCANYLSRLDTDVSILQYPQKPIVRSFVYDTLDTYPAGQNLVV